MTMRVEGLEELSKKISDLASMKAVATGLQAGALHLKGKIAQYPPRRRNIRVQFVSDKQRRFFFWALKEGVIDVPYRRGSSPSSERHGQSWTIKGTNNNLTWTVGSDTSYGPLLQAKKQQTKMHRTTGWQTVEDVVKTEQKDVVKLVSKEVEKLLSR